MSNTKLKKIIYSFNDFIHSEMIGGVFILFSVILALFISNSPLSDYYFNFFAQKISISFINLTFTKPILFIINEFLMTLFFLIVGFEIKRELIAGELSNLKNSLFSIIGAVGGMVFPIIIFIIINFQSGSINGWAIPMATDIALTLGIMQLLGKKVSSPLKVSVTALAIVDDIGALLVIALFFTAKFNLIYLFFSIGIIILLFLIKQIKIHINGVFYIIAGLFLWYFFYKCGIHPTISGVIIAFLIPSNTSINFSDFIQSSLSNLNHINRDFENKNIHFEHADTESKTAFSRILSDIKKIVPPLQRYEHLLHRFVIFFIIPLFAFSNSGFKLNSLSVKDLISPLSLGIIAALIFGKSTGIFLISFISVKLKIANFPSLTKWSTFYGVCWLTGIGFTMSLFIAELSFHEEHLLVIAKASILIGSFLSAIIGILIINFQKNQEQING